MWLLLKDGFLSIVDKDCDPDELLVRARVRSHIEAYFPDAQIERTGGPHRDYLYRAVIKRDEIVGMLEEYVKELSAPNFKNSVKDETLHDAYYRVWNDLARMQEVAPYSDGGR